MKKLFMLIVGEAVRYNEIVKDMRMKTTRMLKSNSSGGDIEEYFRGLSK